MPISDLVTTVARIRCYLNDTLKSSASGFFYKHDDVLCLITNRHVVIDEAEDYRPDEVRLKLHTDRNDILQNADLSFGLYNNQAEPLWLEHPILRERIDVVAIPLDREDLSSRFVIKAFQESDHIPSNVDISIGEDVLVIGYPLGFHDEFHNLPIVRNAIMASVYPVPFMGNQIILVDSRLHSGTSRSPVITKASNILRHTNGNTSISSGREAFWLAYIPQNMTLKTEIPLRMNRWD